MIAWWFSIVFCRFTRGYIDRHSGTLKVSKTVEKKQLHLGSPNGTHLTLANGTRCGWDEKRWGCHGPTRIGFSWLARCMVGHYPEAGISIPHTCFMESTEVSEPVSSPLCPSNIRIPRKLFGKSAVAMNVKCTPTIRWSVLNMTKQIQTVSKSIQKSQMAGLQNNDHTPQSCWWYIYIFMYIYIMYIYMLCIYIYILINRYII